MVNRWSQNEQPLDQAYMRSADFKRNWTIVHFVVSMRNEPYPKSKEYGQWVNDVNASVLVIFTNIDRYQWMENEGYYGVHVASVRHWT